MTAMDKLPTVISCCFCCFLRAGTVMISLVSFLIGLMLAPNVSHSRSIWSMGPLFSNYTAAEEAIQVILGAVSIGLCCISFILLVGAICNVPLFIEIYQWGALMYCIIVCLLFFVLAGFCFFLRPDCLVAGLTLLGLSGLNILVTAYFLIVTNSLRVSLRYLVRSSSALA